MICLGCDKKVPVYEHRYIKINYVFIKLDKLSYFVARRDIAKVC